MSIVHGFKQTFARVATYNFFNRNDQALEIIGDLLPSPWKVAQLAQKPYVSGLGVGGDPYGLTWALNEYVKLDDDYNALWQGDGDSANLRAQTTRSWAELAFQIQPVSGPAGAQRLTFLADERNIEMTQVGGSGGLMSNFSSHTYWTEPLSRVKLFFDRLAAIFERNP